MQRNVTPEEMVAIAQLASENPDLRAVVVELGQLRALKAAAGNVRAPLLPASFREVLKALLATSQRFEVHHNQLESGRPGADSLLYRIVMYVAANRSPGRRTR